MVRLLYWQTILSPLEEIDNLEQTITQLRSELLQITQDRDALSSKLHNAYRELIENQQHSKTLQDTVMQLQNSLEQRQAVAAKQALELENEQLRDKVSKLESQLKAQQANVEQPQPFLELKQRDSLLNLNHSLGTLQQLLNGAVISVSNVKSQLESITSPK